jgi:signal transduction histidine kinase
MIRPPVPPGEEARLAALRSYCVLDTEPEPAFDRITRLGATVFGTPIVLVSLVDQNRQWFKSCYGLNSRETSRDISFCGHALQHNEPLVIPDALEDVRFQDNPLVTGPPYIRFYAGAPLRTPAGPSIGTFCLIDVKPRPPLSPAEKSKLEDFAALVVEELELRRTARELKDTRAQLRSSEARFAAFMDHSPAVALMHDHEGKVVYFNRAAEQLWGVSAAEAMGKPHPALQSNPTFDRQELVEVLAADGEVRQFLSQSFAFNAADSQTMYGTMSIDVTEQKRLERDLRAMNEALAEQTKLAQEASRLKSEFLANMSHELRTPLNGIIGFSELLADAKAGQLSDRQARFTGNILNSSRHLLRLINDLLDLAKIEAGKMEFQPEVADTRELTGEVLESLQPLISAKQLHLSLEANGGDYNIYADGSRFKQLIYNLVSNAMKFTPEGGRISVRLSEAKQGWIRVEVEDSGIGIGKEDLSRLFRRFEQIETGPAKRFPGTGLGLALVKGIVEHLGGVIEVSSEPGQGSTFSVALPAAMER